MSFHTYAPSNNVTCEIKNALWVLAHHDLDLLRAHATLAQHREKIHENSSVARTAMPQQTILAGYIGRQDNLVFQAGFTCISHQIRKLGVGSARDETYFVDAHQSAVPAYLDQLGNVMRRSHMADQDSRWIHAGALQRIQMPKG